MVKSSREPGENPDDEPSRWDTFARAFRGDDFVGTVVDRRYQITARIGAGGMGVVYRAQHLSLDRPVAVKVLHAALADDPEIRARFVREARAAARINSPHVVSVIDFGPHDERDAGPLFLVMELLEGEDLAQTLKRVGPLPWPRAAEIIMQVCHALQAAHAQGVVHRDIKPQNCYRLSSSSSLALEARVDESTRAQDHIKVLDFGMARLDMPQGNNEPWTIGGTRGYIAPEVLRGERADLRVDIYGVGALLCRLLTNRPPHAVLARIIAGIDAADGPDPVLPAGVLPIVRRAMAGDPNRRFSSALELAEAVRTVYEVHTEIRERDTPASPSPQARPRVASPTPTPTPTPTPSDRPHHDEPAPRSFEEKSTLRPIAPRRRETPRETTTPPAHERRDEPAPSASASQTRGRTPSTSQAPSASRSRGRVPSATTSRARGRVPSASTSQTRGRASKQPDRVVVDEERGQTRGRASKQPDRVVVDLSRGPSFDVLAHVAARLELEAGGAPGLMTRRFADLKPGFTGRERRLRFALSEQGVAIEAYPHLFHGPNRTSYPALLVRELATFEAGTVLYCPRGVSLSPRFVIRAKISDVVIVALHPAGAMRDRFEFLLEGTDATRAGRARETRGETRW